jgi:hypothetical protein
MRQARQRLPRCRHRPVHGRAELKHDGSRAVRLSHRSRDGPIRSCPKS